MTPNGGPMDAEPVKPETSHPEKIELSLDDAVLGVDRNGRRMRRRCLQCGVAAGKSEFCPSCGAMIRWPGGYSLEVSGVDATEVERVALALLQETGRVQPAGDVVHGNKYVVEGPAAAVGENASGSIINTWNSFAAHADMAELSRQLAYIRSRLNPADLEQAALLGAFANAEQSVRAEDGTSVLAWLRKAGRKGLEIAQEVGTTLLTEALKAAMGIG